MNKIKKKENDASTKKIRIILAIVAGIVGLAWWLLMTLAAETEYVYYAWSNLTTEQLQAVGEELQITLPEDFTDLRLVCKNTFVPDAPHSVDIYSSYGEAEATALAAQIDSETIKAEYIRDGGGKIVISYYGTEDCTLHTLVVENGVEHRENLFLLSLLRLAVVAVVVGLILMPRKNSMKV